MRKLLVVVVACLLFGCGSSGVSEPNDGDLDRESVEADSDSSSQDGDKETDASENSEGFPTDGDSDSDAESAVPAETSTGSAESDSDDSDDSSAVTGSSNASPEKVNSPRMPSPSASTCWYGASGPASDHPTRDPRRRSVRIVGPAGLEPTTPAV